MSETTANPQLTGKMFLFERPELLNKEQHGHLKVSPTEERYDFARKARAIPITLSEIPAAMKQYPIVFTSLEQLIPVAVVSVIDEENLFIDAKGDWEVDAYVPGYLRRYPFGVATETDGERMAIVIDAAFPGVRPDGDQPLFENGEPATVMQQAIEFCRTFEQDRIRTAEFARRLGEFDVVKPQSAHYTPTGQTEQRNFADYFGVDENSVRELSDEKFLELRKTGMLPLLYAMVLSMGNWRYLLSRRARRHGLTEADILNPKPQG